MRDIIRNIKRKRIIVLLLALVCTVLSITAVAPLANGASKYPTKSIEVIMGVPAGGGGDVLLRIVTNYLSRELGKPIIVVNKPGGEASQLRWML